MENDNKPVVNSVVGGLKYDINVIDVRKCVYSHDFAGCVIITFTKTMNTEILGTATVDGRELVKCITATQAAGNNTLQIFGIPVHGVLTEYDKTYVVHIEGFVDIEGNIMEPQDIEIITLPKCMQIPGYEEHERIALEAAREGIVLIKNEGNVLPLKKGKVLNVFGKGLNAFRLDSIGAGRINPRYHVGLVRAIEEYSDFTLNSELKSLYMTYKDVVPTEEILQDAYKQSDIAIITITRASGENIDNSASKGEYYLADEEEAMIKAVAGKFDKTVAILNSGYPMDVSWVEKYNIKAVISCGYAGMLGGKALIDILNGSVNPSGKLPDTWSLDYYDIPASKNFYNAIDGKPVLTGDSSEYMDTCYEEDIYVGYRYFETFGKEVAYPFGYGLSYTTFDISIKSLEHAVNKTALTVTVENSGSVQGKEVVQVYSEEPDGKLEKPARKLVAFAKTKLLSPGEKQILSFDIKEESFTSYYTDTASWIIEKGTYTIWVGNSVKNLEKVGSFEFSETKTVKKVANRMSPPVKIHTLSKNDPEGTYPTGKYSGLKSGINQLEPKVNRKRLAEANPIQAEVPKEVIKYTDVLKNSELLGSFVKQMSLEELARLNVCYCGSWGMDGKGIAGRIFPFDKYNMKEFAVADGNTCVNITKPNIGMPASSTVCSTFNTELAYEVGRVLAEEAKENEVHLITGPGMNVHRNPLNGRHPEYFSEDPYLTGIMAGYQSKGLEENGVSSCLKHVVANNCETSRKRNQSLMTERALREIYLKAFEIAIQVHNPDSIMTSYNAVNGVFTAADEEMIQGVFREEFGFEGYVMTDWNSYETIDIVEAVQAGNCWLTPGEEGNENFTTPLTDALKSGRIDRERLEKNIMFFLKVVLKRSK